MKRLVVALTVVLALNLAPAIYGGVPIPTPIIDVSFDENAGTVTANEGSAGGTLTLSTPTPKWATNVPLRIGGVSSVDYGTSTGNYFVESPGNYAELTGLTKFTVTGWVNCRNNTEGSGGNRLVTWINNGGQGADVVYKSDGGVQVGINQWPDGTPARSSAGKITTDSAAGVGNWRFFAVTYDSTLANGHVKFYFGSSAEKATLDVATDYGRGAVGTSISRLCIGHFNIATRANATSRMFRGLIDEVKVFGDALTLEQIQQVQVGHPELASSPNPKDGDKDVAYNDVTLSWLAGVFAKTHDVYVGASSETVGAASPTNTKDMLFTSLGQNGATYEFASPLEFGKTYYWRVDEVNGPPDATAFKGGVWAFTVEPYSYEITGVKATASSSATDMGPEKTTDGSGLTGLKHSTLDKAMWLSSGDAGVTLPAWIMYEFPQTCKLDVMRVWNSNQGMESAFGFGAKDVTIKYSQDGTEWTVLRTQQFQKALGSDDYEGELVPLDGVYAKFVRLEINSAWGTIFQQAGLSEVRFFHIPIRARKPIGPDAGATNVPVDSVLTWRAGREAVTHEVFLSEDQQAVIAGTSPMKVVTENRFAPDALEYGKVYYWKVNEVGAAGTWESEVWSFTTLAYEIVDDMESYTDKPFQEIWATWLDGTEFGTKDPTNGSIVGADPAAANYGPAAGRPASKQSLPIWFNNTASAPKSEAIRTFQPARNWSAHGIKSLSLWFAGDPGNSGQLYVKINDTKMLYAGDAADIKSKQWQPFNIDLSTVNATLGNVTKLTVGVEGAGAKGVIYIDDIRLYPSVPQFTTPADPGRTGLLAEYLFDNGVTDTSGKGHHGTFLDNANVANSVLVLDGTNDAVAIPRIGGAAATFQQCTYSMWMYSAVNPATAGLIGGINFDNWSAGGIHCKLSSGRANAGINGLSGGDMNGTAVAGAQEWVHLALTVSDTKATIYLNGRAERSRTFTAPLTMILGNGSIGAWNTNGDIQRELNGQMDDVRIFDRALSAEEIFWLAGKRAPVHMPF